MPSWTVIESDCVEAMRATPPDTYDAIITDPPYHLTSVSRGGSPRVNDPSTPFGRHHIGDRGFMGKTWDGGGVAFRPETWREVMRVARPGAFLVAFGGTRTYHRLTCAIEDAGWEIRDSVLDLLSEDERFSALWATLTDEQRAAMSGILETNVLLAFCYGSGFPKSHDAALAIDKMLGFPARGRAVPTASTHLPDGKYADEKLTGNPVPEYVPRTEDAAEWLGFGTALKPAFEPIVLARKPLDGTVAKNLLKWGTGAINVDGCRVKSPVANPTLTVEQEMVEAGIAKALGLPPPPPMSTGPSGRWPANLVLEHDSRCVLVGTRTVKGSRIDKPCPEPEVAGHRWGTLQGNRGPRGIGDSLGNEEVEVWACVPGCPVRMLDEQAGIRKSGTGAVKRATGKGYNPNALGAESRPEGTRMISYGDEGGASRFFFCSKAARSEREAGLLGVVPCAKCGGLESMEHPNGKGGTEACVRCDHPTVKNLMLMRHLVRLVSPPGGRVLDPFCGSGTTGCACMAEGLDFVGVENDPRSVLISRARIEHAARTAGEAAVGERAARVRRGEVPKEQAEANEQLGLLGGEDGSSRR